MFVAFVPAWFGLDLLDRSGWLWLLIGGFLVATPAVCLTLGVLLAVQARRRGELYPYSAYAMKVYLTSDEPERSEAGAVKAQRLKSVAKAERHGRTL